jgi:very-short-patch-repair endonuclease
MNEETRAEALRAKLTGEDVVGRRTAAWLWGLDVMPPGRPAADWPVELLTARRPGLDRPGTITYKASLPVDDVVEISGIRCTSLERTALDCVRWLPRYEAVAALDQFLRRGVDKEALRARTPGLRALERIEMGDAGAQSPGESRTRAIILAAGLPRPRCQVEVGPYRLDLGYEQYRVGVEYDGEEHHTGPASRLHDARRRALISQQGWKILIVDKTILTDPVPYLDALLTDLMSRGWDPGEAVLADIAGRLHFMKVRR